eukprot:22864-Rhodomonas_salina.4
MFPGSSSSTGRRFNGWRCTSTVGGCFLRVASSPAELPRRKEEGSTLLHSQRNGYGHDGVRRPFRLPGELPPVTCCAHDRAQGRACHAMSWVRHQRGNRDDQHGTA